MLQIQWTSEVWDIEEYVANLIGSCKNNGAVSYVEIFFSLSSHFTLSNHLHPGIGQHAIFTLLHNWIGFCHGQMLIEPATHSLFNMHFVRPWINRDFQLKSKGKLSQYFPQFKRGL